MALKNKFCPRCMNIIHKNDTVCSKCGMKVANLGKKSQPKEQKIEEIEIINKNVQDVEQDENQLVVDTAKIINEKNSVEKDSKVEEKTDEQNIDVE